ncbi:MAG: aldo/keto reductase [Anaerolineae bacterium]|nr:aldo/keto reductase [Anaerolineae bacterium]
MKYRKLGKTGLRVSVIGVGTWQFGGEWGRNFTKAEAKQILFRARELGINLIDTAECYGDHLSEQLVGHAIRADRDKWIIATKFGHRFTAPFERDQLWSPTDVRRQLDGSLRALETEIIDLYQFHSGTSQVFDQDELWTMLAKQVQAGKIRYLGISISGGAKTAYQAQRASAVGASTIQVVYNRLDRLPEDSIFPACLEQNLGVLARVPLASGFLSGKYLPGAKFITPTDVRSRRDPGEIQQRLEEVARIRRTEVPAGTPMAPWALAWCLQHPAVTCVIPGCKSVGQVESNASAADLDMVRSDHPQAVE